jgi:hypothetical protein
VDPFILGADELRGAARDFPTKLLDIRAHHVVLYGSDPFAEVQPSPEHVRLRVEQELRNLALRLRRRLVLAGDDRRGLAAAAANAVPPLAVNLGTLLELAGAGGEDAADGVFARAAEVFGLDGEALAAARAARDERSGELAPEMLQRLLDVALAAARTATMTTHGRA